MAKKRVRLKDVTLTVTPDGALYIYISRNFPLMLSKLEYDGLGTELVLRARDKT